MEPERPAADALAHLELEAKLDQARPDAGAAAGPGAAPGAATEPRTEPREEWVGSVQFISKIVCAAYPQLAPVYTDERLEQLGGALHGVAAKYGWSIGQWLTRWQAEIALVMVAGPLVRDSAKALKVAKPAAPGARARAAAADDAPPAREEEPAQVVPGTLAPNTGDLPA